MIFITQSHLVSEKKAFYCPEEARSLPKHSKCWSGQELRVGDLSTEVECSVDKRFAPEPGAMVSSNIGGTSPRSPNGMSTSPGPKDKYEVSISG